MQIISSHMPESLERDALLVSTAAVERHKGQPKDVAAFIAKELQKLHPVSGDFKGA